MARRRGTSERSGRHKTTMMLSFLSYGYAALCVFLLLSLYTFVKASSLSSDGSARIRIAVPKLEPLPLHGLKPDKFVASAPLIVAAVCKDGVAVVATHTSPLKEPLLMDETSPDGEDESEEETGRTDSATTTIKLPMDVPLSFRGPFRIQSVDGFGTSLACAGWRTDGEHLAAKFRSLASTEADLFGEPSNALEYGRFLAQEASTWMARCAVSESVSYCMVACCTWSCMIFV